MSIQVICVRLSRGLSPHIICFLNQTNESERENREIKIKTSGEIEIIASILLNHCQSRVANMDTVSDTFLRDESPENTFLFSEQDDIDLPPKQKRAFVKMLAKFIRCAF